jgi:hypothetical protein
VGIRARRGQSPVPGQEGASPDAAQAGRQQHAAGIEKKAVLLGMGNKFELWSEQAHLAQIRQSIGDEDVSDAMLALSL